MFFHQRVCHVFDTNAADHTPDQGSISIDAGGLLKERSEVTLSRNALSNPG